MAPRRETRVQTEFRGFASNRDREDLDPQKHLKSCDNVVGVDGNPGRLRTRRGVTEHTDEDKGSPLGLSIRAEAPPGDFPGALILAPINSTNELAQMWAYTPRSQQTYPGGNEPSENASDDGFAYLLRATTSAFTIYRVNMSTGDVTSVSPTVQEGSLDSAVLYKWVNNDALVVSYADSVASDENDGVCAWDGTTLTESEWDPDSGDNGFATGNDLASGCPTVTGALLVVGDNETGTGGSLGPGTTANADMLVHTLDPTNLPASITIENAFAIPGTANGPGGSDTGSPTYAVGSPQGPVAYINLESSKLNLHLFDPVARVLLWENTATVDASDVGSEAWAAFSPGGNRLAVVTGDGDSNGNGLQIFEVADGSVVATVNVGTNETFDRLAVSSSGRIYVEVTNTISGDVSIEIYDWDGSNETTYTSIIRTGGAGSNARGIFLSVDESTLWLLDEDLTATPDYQLRGIDTSGGNEGTVQSTVDVTGVTVSNVRAHMDSAGQYTRKILMGQ